MESPAVLGVGVAGIMGDFGVEVGLVNASLTDFNQASCNSVISNAFLFPYIISVLWRCIRKIMP